MPRYLVTLVTFSLWRDDKVMTEAATSGRANLRATVAKDGEGAEMQKQTRSDRRVDPMVVAVNALGITQITAWGTSYYCLGVLAKPIVADTGWPMTTVFLGFSVALLVMGFISTWVGRLIDRIGARAVMCLGTIIVSVGLVLLSRAHDPASYLAVWALLGIGMRCCLYDAAFAALVQVTPTRGRKAISYLTLYGAYASTVFWVIGYYLNEAYGWRGTLIAFAAINLTVCLPLNWLGLAHRDRPEEVLGHVATPAASPDGPALEGRMRVVGKSSSLSSCPSTASSSGSSRSSWCRCSKQRGSPARPRSGSHPSRAMGNLPGGWWRLSSAVTSKP
jgi:MFS family permease